jgi:cell division protein FtsQ
MNRRTLVMSASAGLAVLAVVVLVVGVAMARRGDALLPFRYVEVTGPFLRVSAEQVRAAAAPALAHGFLFSSLPEAQQRILTLPWVASVEVRKVWPDTLEVRYVEREVLGHLGDDRLVDRAGGIFQARGAGETRGLPLLDASPEDMPALTHSFQLAQAELSGTGRQIVAARLSPRGSLSLRLNDGMEIAVGTREQGERWRRFVRSLPRIQDAQGRPLVAADLRYTHGFALRFLTPEPAAAAAATPASAAGGMR